MKMIICILSDSDKDEVSTALNQSDFQATVLPSSGAYFRRGNSTLLIGVEDDKLDAAIQVIKDNVGEPDEPGLKRATLFVLNVNRFEQV